MYIELKRIYGFVRDWYENDEIYHYLSYLFSNFKSKVNFVAIYKTWENSKGKLSFITELKKRYQSIYWKYTVVTVKITKNQQKKN